MRFFSFLAIGVCLTFVQTASGTIYQIPVDVGDGSVRNPGAASTTSDVGLFSGESVSLWSAVMPFALPSLATNEFVISANLEFTARRSNTAQNGFPNADLYGLDFRMSSALLSADFFEGSEDLNAAKVADNILTFSNTSTNDALFNTDVSADTLLATYVSNQITSGASAGDFLFLRINMDAGQAGDPRLFIVGSSESLFPDLSSKGAILTLVTAIPEPGSFLLMGMLGMFFGFRRALRKSVAREC